MGDGLVIHPLIKVSLMITDQFAIELGVGGPFVIKASTLKGLLGYTQIIGRFRFRKEY